MANSMLSDLDSTGVSLAVTSRFWPRRCSDGWAWFNAATYSLQLWSGAGWVTAAVYCDAERATSACFDELDADLALTARFAWRKLVTYDDLLANACLPVVSRQLK